MATVKYEEFQKDKVKFVKAVTDAVSSNSNTNMDLEQFHDALPQPYRMIDKIIELDILDVAWLEIIRIHPDLEVGSDGKQIRVPRNQNLSVSCIPSSITERSLFVSSLKDMGEYVIATSAISGTLFVIDDRTGRTLSTLPLPIPTLPGQPSGLMPNGNASSGDMLWISSISECQSSSYALKSALLTAATQVFRITVISCNHTPYLPPVVDPVETKGKAAKGAPVVALAAPTVVHYGTVFVVEIYVQNPGLARNRQQSRPTDGTGGHNACSCNIIYSYAYEPPAPLTEEGAVGGGGKSLSGNPSDEQLEEPSPLSTAIKNDLFSSSLSLDGQLLVVSHGASALLSFELRSVYDSWTEYSSKGLSSAGPSSSLLPTSNTSVEMATPVNMTSQPPRGSKQPRGAEPIIEEDNDELINYNKVVSAAESHQMQLTEALSFCVIDHATFPSLTEDSSGQLALMAMVPLQQPPRASGTKPPPPATISRSNSPANILAAEEAAQALAVLEDMQMAVSNAGVVLAVEGVSELYVFGYNNIEQSSTEKDVTQALAGEGTASGDAQGASDTRESTKSTQIQSALSYTAAKWSLSSCITTVFIEPVNRTLVVLGLQDGCIVLIDIASLSISHIFGRHHEVAVSSLCLAQSSYDSALGNCYYLCSGACDGTLCFFQIRTPTGQSSTISNDTVSSNASASMDKTTSMGTTQKLLAQQSKSDKNSHVGKTDDTTFPTSSSTKGCFGIEIDILDFRHDIVSSPVLKIHNFKKSPIIIAQMGFDSSLTSSIANPCVLAVYDVSCAKLLGKLVLNEGMQAQQFPSYPATTLNCYNMTCGGEAVGEGAEDSVEISSRRAAKFSYTPLDSFRKLQDTTGIASCTSQSFGCLFMHKKVPLNREKGSSKEPIYLPTLALFSLSTVLRSLCPGVKSLISLYSTVHAQHYPGDKEAHINGAALFALLSKSERWPSATNEIGGPFQYTVKTSPYKLQPLFMSPEEVTANVAPSPPPTVSRANSFGKGMNSSINSSVSTVRRNISMKNNVPLPTLTHEKLLELENYMSPVHHQKEELLYQLTHYPQFQSPPSSSWASAPSAAIGDVVSCVGEQKRANPYSVVSASIRRNQSERVGRTPKLLRKLNDLASYSFE